MAKPRRAPDDDALAWALASAAAPHLSRSHGDRIYIAIGIGDTLAAIDDLITVIVRERIPVSDDVVAAVSAWLDCYLGHDSEPGLRELLAELTVSPPPQTLEADTLRRFLAAAAPQPGRRRSAG